MPAIDAAPGSLTANSYVTLATAETYFAGHANRAAWDALDGDDAKNVVLIMATGRLEQEGYRGVRAATTQRLKWPRYGTRSDGLLIDAATVPRFVQEAACEEALAVAAQPNRYDQSGLSAYESVSVGPISVAIRAGGTSVSLAPTTQRLLAEVRIGGAGSFQWLRG